MATCPNGHHSMAEEWCDTCGHRMPAPAGAVPPPPPPGGGFGPGDGRTQACPQCRTPRESPAPFCPQCQYNFLTNSPTNSPTAYLPPVPPGRQEPAQAQHGAYPAAPPPAPPAYGNPQTGQGPGWPAPPPPGPPPAGYGAQGGPGQGGYPGHGGAGTWMVTIGPDREYFGAMMRRSGPEAARLAMPENVPEQQVTLNGPQVTIGRRRPSTGESPDIDLSRPAEDPGVSHQHAVLVQQPDGSWAVVDQDSTNGTTVNGSEEPIQPFVPVPLHDGDHVHVGAWTTLRIYRT
ncbi:hypothetical protein GCM10009716_11170 [Streptomyces sodiiphilus]|uniref:FHA domain-containing protein n=1 Tax=Streptomyces sodiiphilus TaxID=226217 RepID=A0ABP5A6Y1_9ACTN